MDASHGYLLAALSVVLGCFVAHILIFSKHQKLRAAQGCSESPQLSAAQKLKLEVRQVNDSLFELHRPEGTPSMQILFFHGLQLADVSDVHLCTWKSEDGSVIWPREWLVQDFPQAHIFSVSYDEGVSNMDMYVVGENLTSDLMHGNIGQVPYCPVILVGHCVGGLVIKKICLDVHEKLNSGNISHGDKEKLGTFLQNLRGIFYYGTPHRGSSLIAKVQDGPLFKFFNLLNKDAARLNTKFDHLRKLYPKWQVHGLGESLPTKVYWLIRILVPRGLFQSGVAVPEASSREGEVFHIVTADHNSICQPRDRTDRRFSALNDLLEKVTTTMKAEESMVRDETHVQNARPQNFQRLPKETINIDAQMQEIMGKLDDTRILGLAGMGGLGKTTLAMAVFNASGSRFEYTCFIPEVKSITGGEEAVKSVLWDHLYYNGKKVEGQRNWSKLTGKTFLLALDDISLREERVLFDLASDPAPESRFILTSRDQDLLRGLGEVHVVPFWNNNSAQVLFRKHAFPKLEKPPQKLESVMESIIETCGGLPLTLEVLGKFLQKKTKYEDWEQTLSALKKAEDVSNLNERLWAKLRVSYDDLGAKEKQIFLDATTFFASGSWTLRDALAAWRVAYDTESEKLLWDTLVDKSLVYSVEEDECIKVHEQLRQLGERIALEPSNHDKYRVWKGEEGVKMLQTAHEWDGKTIHVLRLGPLDWRNNGCIHIPRAALRNLKKVQFLEVNGPVIIDGATNGVPLGLKEVVLLRCHGQDLFRPDLQTRLAVLELFQLNDLPHSLGELSRLRYLRIHECSVLKLPNSFGKLKALQRLTLSDFRNLETLPDSFGELSALNRLEFDGFLRLQGLPESFGQLSVLDHLRFACCYPLQGLPESFGQLSALNHLQFESCYVLQGLPESFGQLSALNHLQFSFCQELQGLPESFGQLSALNHLRLEFCNKFQGLPESFGQLSALNRLVIYSCRKFQGLPESFGQLSALNYLRLEFCNKFQGLPESFGRLPALNYLRFDACRNLQSLPESFGQLSSLNHLEFWSCRLQTLPQSFGQLCGLVFLTIDECKSLQTLPESFGQLSALNHLEFLRCSKLKTLPQSFGQLCGLVFLRFYKCKSLQTLPESFGKLVTLELLLFQIWSGLERLPEALGQSSALKTLQFTHCDALIQQLFNIERLPISSGNFTGLSDLSICYDSTRSIPDCIRSLPSLRRLKLYLEADLLAPLPTWLVSRNVSTLILRLSEMVFQVQEGCGSLIESESTVYVSLGRRRRRLVCDGGARQLE